MQKEHLWNRVKRFNIQTSDEIAAGFSIGFDAKIPEMTKDALMDFVYWVEDRFPIPITLWVDFKYRHYLVDKQGNRVGYKFYWADFKNYPRFDDPDDIPVIELPVRREHSSMEEILFSFIEAISLYYTWLTGAITEAHHPNEAETAEVLYTYLKEKNYGEL